MPDPIVTMSVVLVVIMLVIAIGIVTLCHFCQSRTYWSKKNYNYCNGNCQRVDRSRSSSDVSPCPACPANRC